MKKRIVVTVEDLKFKATEARLAQALQAANTDEETRALNEDHFEAGINAGTSYGMQCGPHNTLIRLFAI